jgi:excisionase family DNA binding protein
MESLELKKEFQELKSLTLLGAKQALTMTDASLLTGLSKSHIYKLVCAKKIPYYKSQGGKLTYFSKSEVEAWCLNHRVKTSDELETEAANYVVSGKRSKKGGANV